MKRLYPSSPRTLALAAALLCALTSPAHAREPLRDLAAFAHWTEENLACRGGDGFLEDVQSRAFLDHAKTLGVTFVTDWQEGDIPEGEFELPAPVRIGGQAATHIYYWGDSGAEFYAIVQAPAEAMAQALKTKPVPAKLRSGTDDRTVGLRFTGPAAHDGSLAPAVFVRRGEKDGTSEVGCRYFDG